MTASEAEGFVYLIGSPDGRSFKIGRSGNPHRRLAEIQTMSPIPVELLWTHPGDHEVETYLHRRFADLRSHGEWFLFGEADPVAAVAEAVAAFAQEAAQVESKEVKAARSAAVLAELNLASAEFLQTREELEQAIWEAREAGVPLTAISEHSGFSREWVRKIANNYASKRAA